MVILGTGTTSTASPAGRRRCTDSTRRRIDGAEAADKVLAAGAVGAPFDIVFMDNTMLAGGAADAVWGLRGAVIAAGRRRAAADSQKVALIVLPVCGSNHVRLIRGKFYGRGYGMNLCLELFYQHHCF